MKRADQITGAVLLVFSLAALSESGKMPMAYVTTTGPGFWPFWLSASMLILSAMLVFSGFQRPASPGQGMHWPHGRALVRVVATIGALLAYTYLVGVLGYILSTFALVWVLLWLLGSYRWYWAVTISLTISLSLHMIFRVWLNVMLPTGLFIIP